MKLLKSNFSLFTAGFMLALVVHLAYNCQTKEVLQPPTVEPPVVTPPVVNPDKMLDGLTKAGDAFITGQIASIQTVFSEDAFPLYKDLLSAQAPEKLKSYGSALKLSKLKNSSAIYAEFEFTEDKLTFTVAFALQNDNTWKIVRI